MALQLFVDGVTTFLAAQFRRCIGVASNKVDVHVQYGQVWYFDGAWQVVGTDTAGFAQQNLAFSSGVLTITVSGFAVSPLALTSRVGGSAYVPSIFSASATTVEVRWYTIANTLVTTADTHMVATIFLIGA